MHRSSKYAALALLMSTVGNAALRADEAYADDPSPTLTRTTLRKSSRAADRKAREVSRRMRLIAMEASDTALGI
jgi:hypothetical protein